MIALSFFRGCSPGAFKDNEHLFKGVITGILRIAKESLFSDLNDLGIVARQRRSSAIEQHRAA